MTHRRVSGTHWQTKRELVTELVRRWRFGDQEQRQSRADAVHRRHRKVSCRPARARGTYCALSASCSTASQWARGPACKAPHTKSHGEAADGGVPGERFSRHRLRAALKIARRKHDMIPLVVADHGIYDAEVGLVRLRDAETGKMIVLDTFSKANRRAYEDIRAARRPSAMPCSACCDSNRSISIRAKISSNRCSGFSTSGRLHR